jgi:hypothetical protein
MFFFILFYKAPLTELVRKNIWLFTGFTAFVFGLGKSGILWTLLSKQPIFSKFTNPFKFIPFINIFIIVGAAIVIERILKDYKNSTKIRKFTAIAVFILMFYHCLTPLNPFYLYADKPFGKLPDEVINIVKPGGVQSYRILNISNQDPFYLRSESEKFYHSAAYNYATVFGICSADGYETFAIDSPLYSQMKKAVMERKPEKDFEIMRVFGVKWIFVYEQQCLDESDKNPHLKRVYKFPGQEIAIYELLNTSPMAFSSKNPDKPIKTDFDTEGAVMDTSGLNSGDEIILGVLARPGLYLSAGNEPISFEKDQWGRLKFTLPQSASTVKLTYKAPWEKGIAASIAFIILAVILIIASSLLTSFENRRNQQNQEEPQ